MVLMISLVMLLLMTLIGSTGMQSTVLEEKMAGNMRSSSLAFQASEAALRAAELILGGTLPTFPAAPNSPGNGANGLYNNTVTGDSIYETIDWNSPDPTKPYATSTVSLGGIYATPKYIIEELATTTTGGGGSDGLESETSGDPSVFTWYRVTVRSVGVDANAVVILQSIFRRQIS
jgi:type IV pilus assembly protein PilX